MSTSDVPGRRWTVTSSAFGSLLDRLGPDRQTAGERFLVLHAKLTAYFTLERCTHPQRWADETLDRVAKRLSDGQTVEDINAFTHGVGRLVLFEARKGEARERAAAANSPPPEAPATEAALRCLDKCLAQLAEDKRKLIQRYYAVGPKERVTERREQADEFGISVEALRTRALRIRKELELCLTRCREENDVTEERFPPF